MIAANAADQVLGDPVMALERIYRVIEIASDMVAGSRVTTWIGGSRDDRLEVLGNHFDLGMCMSVAMSWNSVDCSRTGLAYPDLELLLVPRIDTLVDHL